jgi:hypothetical protein
VTIAFQRPLQKADAFAAALGVPPGDFLDAHDRRGGWKS